MRILTNTLRYAPSGGIELHAFQMSKELASRGHVIDVVAQRDGVMRDAYRTFSRTTSVFGDFLHSPLSPQQLLEPIDFSTWTGRISRAVWKSWHLRPDVIYANDQRSLMWACATSQLPEVPIVCHLHGRVAKPMGRQRSILARRVHSFIAPSNYIRNDWIKFGMPPDRIKFIPQAVDPNAYPPSTEESRRSARSGLGVPEDAFVVLYLGRIVPDKGVDILIRAWNSLGLTPNQGMLMVVGPPWPWSYLDELCSMAAPNCRFMDLQSDVIPLMHAADLLVLPSVWDEPFGRVIIEAMATGCPVVASKIGGIPEILTGQFASMMFEPGNADQLADQLQRMRCWRREDPLLATACTAHVAENFQLSAVANELENILEGSKVHRWRTRLAR